MDRCYSMNPQGWEAVHLEIAPHYYFRPSAKPGWSSAMSMQLLLDICERMKWRAVGTTAFGEGSHEEALELLRSWRGMYPDWIRIFHLDYLDFEGIKGRLRRVQ